MSETRLSKWNDAFGYPIQQNTWLVTRRKNVIFKCLTFFPFVSSIVAIRNGLRSKEKKSPIPKLVWTRLILTATIVGIPLTLVLDIFTTLITQPIGRCLEHQVDIVLPDFSETFSEISDSDTETKSISECPIDKSTTSSNNLE